MRKTRGSDMVLAAAPAVSAKRALSRRAGAVSVIELMVVMLVMTIVAVGASRAIGAALSLRQMYRDEAAVRQWLCMKSIMLERRLSMAESVVELTNGVYQAVYRLESAGACMETNFLIRVTSAAITTDSGGFLVQDMTTGDPRHADTQWFSSTPSEGVGCPAGARLTSLELRGEGTVRRLDLTAEYLARTTSGAKVSKTVRIDRAVRLWNRKE
jgi:hypothetical protein